MARHNKNRPDPLFEAIRADDLKTVRMLMETQPERVNAIAPKYPLDTRGMSPLQVALCTGWHRSIAWLLLEHGANVNYCAEKAACDEAHPVLFDAVCAAIWNARRYEWDGTDVRPLRMVWKHTKADADEAFQFLQRMLERGADPNQTDVYGRNSLMEAVAEANKLCPIKDESTGKFYPGRQITPEMREDFRRIFQLLLDAGADRENRSAFLGKTIAEHHQTEPIWQICGDLWANAQNNH